ncbi:CLUMA_CG002780, isoform A [Clunio marinus]|uniref:CLUMA_CG002780, isoform A n=1 Tax=Clunio marinus TaxID=568069 RepID=A0A1J1HNG5_9DIPT|nr:CLUMA_CG002780, isoform A [Clunio marinus]
MLTKTFGKSKLSHNIFSNSDHIEVFIFHEIWGRETTLSSVAIRIYLSKLCKDEIKRRRALSIEGQAEKKNDELNQENSLNFKDRMTIEANESAVKKSIQDDETPTIVPKDESAV